MQQLSNKGDAVKCLNILKKADFNLKRIEKKDLVFMQNTSPQIQRLTQMAVIDYQQTTKPKEFFFQELMEKAYRLDQNGIFQTNQEQIQFHLTQLKQVTFQQDMNYLCYTPGVDEISAKNICHKKVEELVPVQIKDLKNFVVDINFTSFENVGNLTCWGGRKQQLVSVSLYNLVENSCKIKECQKLFPVNTRLGIKNPYLKCFNTGYVGLRVDHPVNVIKILPLQQEQNTSTQDKILHMKEQANLLFKQKEYYQAETLYSQALDLLKLNPQKELQIQLLNNRSFSLIKMRRYEHAFAAALEVLKIDSKNQKGRFRKGEALFGLSKYKTALETFEELKSEGLQEAIDKILMIKTVIKQQSGDYDIESIPTDIEGNFEGFSNYYGPLIIKETKSTGRGLFLTQDVSKGQILLVEKAFAYGTKTKNSSNPLKYAINYETKKINDESQEQVVNQCVKRSFENKLDNAITSTLYSGSDSPMEIPDFNLFRSNEDSKIKTETLSLSTIRNIVQYNSFEGLQNSTFLYLVASFLNHQAMFDCNTVRECRGQMLIIIAISDLKTGTELTHNYVIPGNESSLKSWGIN